MNFLIWVFSKDQIFSRAGLSRYFLNRECLLWNHAKNLFNYEITVYGAGEIKKHVSKQKVTIYPTVQQNKYAIRSKFITSQFLSTSEETKIVVGCALLPENSILHIVDENWLYITTPFHSSCFKGCWACSNN